MSQLTPDDFADARRRWLAGRCPCCGSDIVSWDHTYRDESYEPEAIGEGVILCGRCIGNDHHVTPGFTEALLRSLVP